jgi:hypothetical protein
MGIPTPRTVLFTNEHWMAPYHRLEEFELGTRLSTGRKFRNELLVWLKQLWLLTDALSGEYPRGTLGIDDWQALNYRLNLIGLSVSNSKLALDSTLSGHYNGALAIIRHSLETWRRVASVRIKPSSVWRWCPEAEWSGEVRKSWQGSFPPKTPDLGFICGVFAENGDERDCQRLIQANRGFEFLNDHAHPTLLGAGQTVDLKDPSRRLFAPHFDETYAGWSIYWGLIANQLLVEELGVLADRSPEWRSVLTSVHEDLASLLESLNERFRSDEIAEVEPLETSTCFCQQLRSKPKR